MTTITVLRGPARDVDSGTWEDLATSSATALGVDIRCVDAGDVQAFTAALSDIAERGDAAVLVPGHEMSRERLEDAAAVLASDAVWLDVDATAATGRTVHGQLSIQGRGVAGLTWAIRRLVNQRRWPARTIELRDSNTDCWAELRLPNAAQPVPAVVLVHGGFWRSCWQLDLMDALAIDLAERGIAAWNLEFRRPDRHGWETTTKDVAEGIGALMQADPLIDPSRVALVGHSAGSQLVLRAAADGVMAACDRALVVSLAGVVDLVAAQQRDLGDGAVERALGGAPDDLADAYAASSPLARIPIGVHQLIVQGTDDDVNLIEMNRRYAAAAHQAGDPVNVLEEPADHFAVIDPAAPVWHQVADHIAQQLGARG